MILYLTYHILGNNSDLQTISIIIAIILFTFSAFITGERFKSTIIHISIPIITVINLQLLPLVGFVQLSNPLTSGTAFLFSIILSLITGITGGYISERIFLTRSKVITSFKQNKVEVVVDDL